MEAVDVENIVFRTDGGEKIGIGHIMRCLTLAKEFRSRGCNVTFISRLDKGIELIKSSGFECQKIICQKSGYFYSGKEEFVDEVEKIAELIKRIKVNIIVIDTYNVNKVYFCELKNKIGTGKICYIDDWNKFKHNADIIINGNITGPLYNYDKIYTNDELLLIGTEYCILREEFRNIPKRKIKKDVLEVMVTSGGADSSNMCRKIAKILLENYNNIVVNVIIGVAFEDKGELYSLANEYENINLYENASNIAYLMQRSDVAVSAGGSTLYELCACGIPTLAYITADNQEALVDKMSKDGYVINMGWFGSFPDEVFIQKTEYVFNNYDFRINISRKMQSLIDGKGAVRIVDVLLQKKKHRK
jgi:UDP-2,4-diacetamido-2,4,6-trideoxy-beta-L-altropyranose hydrolase